MKIVKFYLVTFILIFQTEIYGQTGGILCLEWVKEVANEFLNDPLYNCTGQGNFTIYILTYQGSEFIRFSGYNGTFGLVYDLKYKDYTLNGLLFNAYDLNNSNIDCGACIEIILPDSQETIYTCIENYPNCNNNHTNFSFYSGPLVSPLSGSNEPCLSYPRKYEFNLGDNVQLYTSITMNQQPLKFRFHTLIEDPTGSTQDYNYPATYIELLAGQCANFNQYITTDIVGVYTVYNYVIYEDGTESVPPFPPYAGYTYTFEVKQIEAPVCEVNIEMVSLTDNCGLAPRIVSTGEILRVCGIQSGLTPLPDEGRRAKIGYNPVSCGPSLCNFSQKHIEITCIEPLEPSADVQFILPSKNVNYLDTFSIPVTVIGFKDIIGFQFPVTWDSTKLEYMKVHSLNKKLPNFNNNTMAKIENYPIVNCVYFHPNELPLNLPLSDTLFFIQFRALKNVCDSSFVYVQDYFSHPTRTFVIEIFNPQFQTLSFTVTDSKIKINQNLCNDPTCKNPLCTNPNNLTFSAPIIDAPKNTNVCIPIRVRNFNQMQGGQGTITWDPTILKYTTVKTTVLDGIPNIANGFASGNGFFKYIFLNDSLTTPINLADNTIFMELCFDVIGAVGQESCIIMGQGNLETFWENNIGPVSTCLEFGKVTISQQTCVFTNFNITPTSCGLDNGSIVIDDPNRNFEVKWQNIVSTEREFKNLKAGSYSIEISLGSCVRDTIIIINSSTAVAAEANVFHTKCGQNNGSITLSNVPSNTHTYSWSNGSTNASLTNLPKTGGNYSVTITRNDGCKGTIQDIKVNSSEALSIIPIVTQPDCGMNNGMIELPSVIGYTYNWGNNNQRVRNNLAPGTYSYTVTNIINCTATGIVKIDSSSSLNATINITRQPTCKDGDGAVIITPYSNNPDEYIYKWSDLSVSDHNPTYLKSDTEYKVTVTRTSDNCTDVKSIPPQKKYNPSVSINSTRTLINCFDPGPIILSLDINNKDIQGNIYPVSEYRWSTNEQLTSVTIKPVATTTYTVTIFDSNGCSATAQQEIKVDQQKPGADIQVQDGTIINCYKPTLNISANLLVGSPPGSYNYLWNNGNSNASINAGQAGTYSVIITSQQNGCKDTAQLVIGSNITKPDFTLKHNGKLTCIRLRDTLDINIDNKSLYHYLWVNTQLETIPRIVNNPGTYQLAVTNIENGCKENKNFTVNEDKVPPTVELEITPDLLTCEKDSATIRVLADGNKKYAYQWFNDKTGPIIHVKDTTTISVLVTDLSNGCQNTGKGYVGIDTNQIVGAYCGDPFNFDYRFIQDDCSCKQGCASIHIDEYDDQLITLRGDGYFRLPLANLFESNELTIVNRWGQAVYKKSGYLSNSDEGWRGQIFDTGDFVPDGAYYFSIDLQPGQKGCRFAGSITIIR